MGADAAAYGDAFADVYDDWYGDITDVETTVATVAELAGAGPVLELGVGTGRIAVPLAATGPPVVGVDASRAMLDRLVAKPGADRVISVQADMAALPLAGRFSTVLVAFNTLFNVATAEGQRACVRDVARLLEPGGAFVVEAFVPSPEPTTAERGRAQRNDGLGGTVVTTTVRDPSDQTVHGRSIHTDVAGIVTERPWTIRYLHPVQLDDLCRDHGLELAHRWASFARDRFDPDGDRHVSVYRHGA